MSSKTATKIQVSFDVPGRSVYDLSHSVRFDTQVGAITPITHIDCLPRDRFDIRLSSLVKTFPTKAPIMGRFKARIYAFFAPDRLYVPELRPNGILMRQTDPNSSTMRDGALYPVLPFYTITAGAVGHDAIRLPHTQGGFLNDEKETSWTLVVGKGSLLEHVGFAQGFWNRTGGDYEDYRLYSALRVMMYYDVFRNYFANPQEPTFPVYGFNVDYPAIDEIGFVNLRFSSLQAYYENMPYQRGATYRAGYTPDDLERTAVVNPLLSHDWDAYLTSGLPLGFDIDSPFGQMFGSINASSMGGLCLKTYTPDINSVFVSDALYQAAIARSIVSVAGGQLNMQDLLAGEKLFNYFTKMAATGARFDEFVRAEWGVNITNRLDIPVYLKSWSFEIGFDDVVSQSATADEPLGSLAGRGLGGMTDNDTFTFTPEEYGTLAFYMTIEPYPDYYQGNDPMLSKTQFIDRFTPSMDRMGFQPLQIEQLNVVGNTTSGDRIVSEDGRATAFGYLGTWNDDPDMSVGQQPAWQEYKGMVSRVRGDVASELRYWTLARDIDAGKYTTYIEPSQFMYAFDDTSADSRPFIVQCGFSIRAKRGISHRSLETF